ALRNDIPGVATMYLRHGNNGGFKRCYVTAGDGLQSRDDLSCCNHRVSTFMWHGSMSTLACDFDLKCAKRRHHGIVTRYTCAHIKRWAIVQAIDRVNGKICEQTFTNHFAATAVVFFCWLKDEMHCAIKFEL